MGLNQPPKSKRLKNFFAQACSKENEGGGNKVLILIWKRRNIFFQDRKFVICYPCLLLPGKKTAGKFSINTVITSPGLKELQWAFFKAQPLCTEGTVTHMHTQKAALPYYGVCTTALSKYLY